MLKIIINNIIIEMSYILIGKECQIKLSDVKEIRFRIALSDRLTVGQNFKNKKMNRRSQAGH